MTQADPSDLASAAGEKIDPILETLALTDSITLALTHLPDGKFKSGRVLETRKAYFCPTRF